VTVVSDVERFLIWEDELWRLEMRIAPPAAGVSYLESKRDIPSITDLDGDEAATFGGVLSYISRLLKEETGAGLVTVSVPGSDTPRLRVHLMPQAGITEHEWREVAERVRRRLADDPPPQPEEPQLPPMLPFPSPQPPPWRRPDEEPEPEIPPPWREPPDEPWPDRPAHDPWFSRLP
jgi:diadenosine tetraphosphate (Ap4A) HIT family hydrolase